AAVVIPMTVLIFAPSLQAYRGLSGIDSSLFGLLLTAAAKWSRASIVLGVAFIAKLVVELVTGRAFFVDSAAAQFVPWRLAHLAGLLIGAVIGCVPVIRRWFAPPRAWATIAQP